MCVFQSHVTVQSDINEKDEPSAFHAATKQTVLASAICAHRYYRCWYHLLVVAHVACWSGSREIWREATRMGEAVDWEGFGNNGEGATSNSWPLLCGWSGIPSTDVVLDALAVKCTCIWHLDLISALDERSPSLTFASFLKCMVLVALVQISPDFRLWLPLKRGWSNYRPSPGLTQMLNLMPWHDRSAFF